MKQFSFPTAPDPAFLFGCGRFRMEEHLLERCAEEVLKFGCHPLLVCDDNSAAIAASTIDASLKAEGVELRELRHNGFCCRDDALAYAESGALESIDVVLGCGGGVILDFSKCLAHLAGAPVVTMPTSSATCCAYTPIAVCYTREGRYVSTSHFRHEIASALLDTTILSRQPPRLLAAGALDAMAKKIEIEFWSKLPAAGSASGEAASRIAEVVSDFIYNDLDRKIDAAIADLARGEPTPTLRDVFFDAIVGAGVVSGISGGSRQTAIAHRFYFFAKQSHPEKMASRTHGELVAVGLVMQLAYNGHMAEAESFAARLRGWGLPASMGDLGLPFDNAEADACTAFIEKTKTMKAAIPVDASAIPRLRESMKVIFK